MKLEVGKTYNINHSRQGRFRGKLLRLFRGGLEDTGIREFGDFEITSGEATFITRDPLTTGDVTTIGIDLATITIPDTGEEGSDG